MSWPGPILRGSTSTTRASRWQADRRPRRSHPYPGTGGRRGSHARSATGALLLTASLRPCPSAQTRRSALLRARRRPPMQPPRQALISDITELTTPFQRAGDAHGTRSRKGESSLAAVALPRTTAPHVAIVRHALPDISRLRRPAPPTSGNSLAAGHSPDLRKAAEAQVTGSTSAQLEAVQPGSGSLRPPKFLPVDQEKDHNRRPCSPEQVRGIRQLQDVLPR